MRPIIRTLDGGIPHWVGDGFYVRTLFSYADGAAAFSPFLLLDYAAPREFAPTRARRGVGQHPHRGFETVTIAFEGEVEHTDSAGNRGRIGAGDVQWMTAGAGVLHEEFHGREFALRGGEFEMTQVWVNLPASEKMTAPRYQDIDASRIPTVDIGSGAQVRVVAGTFQGTDGPARTVTPVEFLDVRLAASATADLELPRGHTTVLVARRGPVRINDATDLPMGHVAVLDPAGGAFRLTAESAAGALVLGGEPIPEPVVGRGPFVMNTAAEIAQAYSDLQTGRFGQLA